MKNDILRDKKNDILRDRKNDILRDAEKAPVLKEEDLKAVTGGAEEPVMGSGRRPPRVEK